MINVEIKDNKLVITADLETPTPSASGKSLTIASTRGNLKTGVKHPDTGKEIVIGLNAYLPR